MNYMQVNTGSSCQDCRCKIFSYSKRDLCTLKSSEFFYQYKATFGEYSQCGAQKSFIHINISPGTF